MIKLVNRIFNRYTIWIPLTSFMFGNNGFITMIRMNKYIGVFQIKKISCNKNLFTSGFNGDLPYFDCNKQIGLLQKFAEGRLL